MSQETTIIESINESVDLLKEKLNLKWLNHKVEEQGDFIVVIFNYGRHLTSRLHFINDLDESTINRLLEETLYRIQAQPDNIGAILNSLQLYLNVLPLVNPDGVEVDYHPSEERVVITFSGDTRMIVESKPAGTLTTLVIDKVMTMSSPSPYVWAAQRESFPEVLRTVFFDSLSEIINDTEHRLASDELEVKEAVENMMGKVSLISSIMRKVLV